MSAWVGEVDRAVVDIRIPVQSLRPAGDDAIRAGETSQGGVVVAGIVKIQPQRGFIALAGEFVVRAKVAKNIPRLAPGRIARFGSLDAG